MNSRVESDKGANRGTLVYLIIVGLVGGGLIALAVKLELGDWAYILGGLLGLTGVLGPVGLLMGGGHGIARCPACGHAASFLGEGQDQALRCEACKAWMLTRGGVITLAPDDYVAPHPVFTTALPAEGVVWPSSCPSCGASATRSVEVKGYNTADIVRNTFLPVGIQRSVIIAAPACSDHDDGVALLIHSSSQQELGFRSLRYLKAFEAANT